MMEPASEGRGTTRQRLRAYAVHVYTASGIAFAFLATAEMMRSQANARTVLLWLIAAVLVDATDGPLARRWQVKKYATAIDGRTIDDILDYLTFTFIPLLLVWRMEWLPAGSSLFIILAMLASLLGFANVHAKFDDAGFFLGFPSYWNIYAIYAGLLAQRTALWVPLVLLIGLTILTLLPVRFIYPNRAPLPWRKPVLIGAGIWLLLILAMLPNYPSVPDWLLWLSLIYPLCYFLLSIHLDLQARRMRT